MDVFCEFKKLSSLQFARKILLELLRKYNFWSLNEYKEVKLGQKLKSIKGLHTLNMAYRDENNILDKIHENNYVRRFIMKFLILIEIHGNAYLHKKGTQTHA